MIDVAVTLPYEGLPVGWAALFSIAFVLICAIFVWTITLFVRGIEDRSRSASTKRSSPWR